MPGWREGVLSLHAVGRIFHVMTQASGKIPQISVVLGPAAGGAAYGPALTDVVILGPEGRIFVTGPDVVRSVTGEDVDMLRLGGPEPHGRRSGVVHILTDTEGEALDRARTVAALLGSQGSLKVDDVEDRDLAQMLPESKKRAYDVHPLVEAVLDEGTGSELHHGGRPTSSPRSAASAAGRSAWSPTTRCASAAASTRCRPRRRRASCACATRSACRSMVVVDVPGYLPGVGQEWDGVVRRGAKLLHAFGECVVPRVTLVTRKTYGGAYIAMNARSLGATKVFAWPGAEVAVMGAVAAMRILHRRRLAEVLPRPAPARRGRARRRARAARRRRRQGGRDRRRRRGRRPDPHAQRHRARHRRRGPAGGVAAATTATSRSERRRTEPAGPDQGRSGAST